MSDWDNGYDGGQIPADRGESPEAEVGCRQRIRMLDEGLLEVVLKRNPSFLQYCGLPVVDPKGPTLRHAG